MQTKRLWMLGVSVDEKISTPRARLRLQRMARLAMTLKGFRKRKKRR